MTNSYDCMRSSTNSRSAKLAACQQRPRPNSPRVADRNQGASRASTMQIVQCSTLTKLTASYADHANIFPPPPPNLQFLSYVAESSSMIPLLTFSCLLRCSFFFFLLVSFILPSTLGGTKCKSLLLPAGYRGCDAYANDVSNHLCSLLLPALIRIHYATKFPDSIYERHEINCCTWHWV